MSYSGLAPIRALQCSVTTPAEQMRQENSHPWLKHAKHPERLLSASRILYHVYSRCHDQWAKKSIGSSFDEALDAIENRPEEVCARCMLEARSNLVVCLACIS